MGAPATQSNTGSQVYFDPDKQQYYTLNVPPSTDMPSGMYSMLSPLFNIASDSSQYRSYLANPTTQNRTPQGTVSPYPSTDALFPALNAGLLDSLLQGSQPTGAMYGAGKYLTGTNLLSMPTTTTSESKGK
jgi:hypothetical protein